jgi:hypothetical protein
MISSEDIMMFSILLMSTLISPSHLQVGRVLQVKGDEAKILREKVQIPLNEKVDLLVGDTAQSKESSALLYLFSETQIYLYPQSEIKISEKNLWLKRGTIRVRKMKLNDNRRELLLSADKIEFSNLVGEFEATSSKNTIELNVINGEVEASSPLVMTFVPEIIKAREGFRFVPAERKFERIKYSLKEMDMEFLTKKELK